MQQLGHMNQRFRFWVTIHQITYKINCFWEMEQFLLLIHVIGEERWQQSLYPTRLLNKHIQISSNAQNIKHFQKFSPGLYSWNAPRNSFLKPGHLLDFVLKQSLRLPCPLLWQLWIYLSLVICKRNLHIL